MRAASGGVQPSKGNRNVGTRESFIKAGLDLFGDYGLEGASTRMLAQKAGANISGIAYYFGGKDGLYQAVLERIVDRFNDLTFETRADIRRRLEKTLDKAEALNLIKNLILSMSRILDDKLKVKNAEKIIFREQTSPTKAFATLYDGYMKDVVMLLAKLVGLYTGQSADSDEIIIRAHTLIGQFASFAVTKKALLKNLGVTKLKAEQSELIRTVIIGNVEACLRAWAQDGAKP